MCNCILLFLFSYSNCIYIVNANLLVFVACLLSTKHEGVREKTGWPGIGMCLSGATCLPADCYYSHLAL